EICCAKMAMATLDELAKTAFALETCKHSSVASERLICNSTQEPCIDFHGVAYRRGRWAFPSKAVRMPLQRFALFCSKISRARRKIVRLLSCICEQSRRTKFCINKLKPIW